MVFKNHVKHLTRGRKWPECQKPVLHLRLCGNKNPGKFTLGPVHLRPKQKPTTVPTRYPGATGIKLVNLVIPGGEGVKY